MSAEPAPITPDGPLGGRGLCPPVGAGGGAAGRLPRAPCAVASGIVPHTPLASERIQLMQPRRRFRFIKELSEGAFGKVYLAEMITGENFKSVVAIKLLHGKWTTHQEIVQRSRDEARVLGLLHHRNIIRVEDLTSINGQCAIVMEYLEGVDLKWMMSYLKDKGKSTEQAFDILPAT